MKRTFLAIGLAFALGLPAGFMAQAKTPPEVLEPYKAYRAALKADKKEEAAELAHDAWQAAEEHLGDHKTTGDLASNFADLEIRELRGKRADKLVSEAYRRSIDLAKFSEDYADEFEVQRRIDYLAWAQPRSRSINLSKFYNLRALKAQIDSYSMINTTYHADYLSLEAQRLFFKRQWKKTEVAANEAAELYGTVTDNLPSYFKYVVPIYLGKSLSEQRKPVEAALVYQDLIDAIDRDAGHDNPVSDATYGEWLDARDRALDKHAGDPRVEAIRNYQVPTDRTAELSPLIRVPPRFTRELLSASNSAKVRLRFNIDIDGRVIIPVIIQSSDRRFHDAALECLEDWRYTPNLPEAASRDIETTIAFSIAKSSGKILSFKPMVDRLK